MAALSGAAMAGKLPRLETLLRDTSEERAPQTPDEVRQAVMAWASTAGLTVHPREVAHG